MLGDDPVSLETQRRHEENKSRLQDALGKIGDFDMLTQGLEVTRRALNDFGGDQGKGLAISFNGGKDACVVLYLLLFVLAERDELWRLSSSTMEHKGHIPVVYFEKEEFPEIEAFMRETSETYGFEFVKYAKSYKDGMQDLVDSRGIEAVIMGQRRGDPWTEDMKWFTASSPGWAKFTRVNPALEWKFCDVWRLLRGSGLPYCVLYDQGYTSLGERGDTAKNEALRLPDGRYRPAYELAEREEYLERSPRTPTNGSPRSTPGSSHGNRIAGDRGGGGDCSDGGGGGGGGVGGGGVGGKGRARFSSWDKMWNSLGAGSPQEGTAVASTVSGVEKEPPKGIVSASRGPALQPSGKVRGGGGWGAGLTGWVENWLPVTTVVLALALAAVGLRSYSGSPRDGGHDASSSGGAQDEGD